MMTSQYRSESLPEQFYASCADRQLAQASVDRLIEALNPDQQLLWEQLMADPAAICRLGAIFGYSTMLTDLLIVRPELLVALREEPGLALMGPSAKGNDKSNDKGSAEEQINSVRLAYYQRLITIAAYDLTAGDHIAGDLTATDPLDYLADVSSLLAQLADQTLEAMLGLARKFVPQASDITFSIIAMGKTGAKELNYISDVDVIYIAEPAAADLTDQDVTRIGSQVATWITQAVSAPGTVPALWELDANLRPEGKNGPLVRTLASHQAYYERWAQPWEFQALLKARAMAGDRELAARYLEYLEPLIWNVAHREGFVDQVRNMRQRVEAHIPRARADRELKLGAGGLRDIEFSVQLLELVHGRTDEHVRVPNTLKAIEALSAGGYIGREAGATLAHHYRFLRLLEHRIQLQRLQRTHEVPPVGRLAKIAASLGFTATDLEQTWQQVRRDVRKLHTAIFYHPLLPSLASLDADNVVLEEHAAHQRLAAIGFKDPRRALRNLHALTAGVSRTAVIQRHVLPAMVGWMAQAAEPDQGLNAFRDVSQRLGSTSWYMRLLRDSARVAPRLAQVLATSRYVAALLPTLPEAISWLDDDALLAPRQREDVAAELSALVKRRRDPQAQAMAGRYLRRRENLRMALGQVLHVVTPAQVRPALSDVTDIAIEAALAAACQELSAHNDYCVIAAGRLGGSEIGYVSDADLMFIYRPDSDAPGDQADREAQQVGRKTLEYLTQAGTEPSVVVDTQLRPEGKNGALVRSVSSYISYYQRWGESWERQALLRARYCAGNQELAEEFLGAIAEFRYPPAGITAEQVRDIQMLKIRMEKERIGRGSDPLRQLKLGRGGLSDVEWTVQRLQLEYAGQYPQLQLTGTLAAIAQACEVGVLAGDDADKLKASWEQASLIRDAHMLATGKTGSSIDILPNDPEVLRLMAGILDIPATQSQEIVESYLRAARRARDVMRSVFYEEER